MDYPYAHRLIKENFLSNIESSPRPQIRQPVYDKSPSPFDDGDDGANGGGGGMLGLELDWLDGFMSVTVSSPTMV
jgi:hypothetical protein